MTKKELDEYIDNFGGITALELANHVKELEAQFTQLEEPPMYFYRNEHGGITAVYETDIEEIANFWIEYEIAKEEGRVFIVK